MIVYFKCMKLTVFFFYFFYFSNYLQINEEESINFLMFDGKPEIKDVRLRGENGRRFPSTQCEKHVTLVGQPGNVYLSHMTRKTKDDWLIANAVKNCLIEYNLDNNILL